jgi:hypothetical protein
MGKGRSLPPTVGGEQSILFDKNFLWDGQSIKKTERAVKEKKG